MHMCVHTCVLARALMDKRLFVCERRGGGGGGGVSIKLKADNKTTSTNSSPDVQR